MGERPDSVPRATPVKRKKRAKPNLKKLVRLMPMRVLRMEKGDLLVMQTDLLLDRAQCIELRDRATEQFGEQFGRIAVLTAGLKLGVLRKVAKQKARKNSRP